MRREDTHKSAWPCRISTTRYQQFVSRDTQKPCLYVMRDITHAGTLGCNARHPAHSLRSLVAERQTCNLKVLGSIPSEGFSSPHRLFFIPVRFHEPGRFVRTACPHGLAVGRQPDTPDSRSQTERSPTRNHEQFCMLVWPNG